MFDKPSYEDLLLKIGRLEHEAHAARQLEATVRQQEKSLREGEEKFRLRFERSPLSYQSLADDGEERYRTIFEQAAVGIVHCDLEGRFLRVNARFAEFIGYSCEELLHLDIRTLTITDDIPADLAGLNSLLTGRSRQFSRDKRYLRKDGSIVWGQRCFGNSLRGSFQPGRHPAPPG